MKRWGIYLPFFTLLLSFAATCPDSSKAADKSDGRAGRLDAAFKQAKRSLAVDGEFVHNIGKLQMNITNWGFVGSLPKSLYPMSESPSAQWPAGTGVEYLYAAGLWVGALRNGMPIVSTGYPETEFYPGTEEIHTIYRSFEGDRNGTSYPGFPDDDQDGSIDEDWLNGMDDDGDGLIDEDFAAIGKQMFSCWYTDDMPMARAIWPEHTPMNIGVRQETYQWGEDGFDEFVAARYWISNIGYDFLTSLYIGIYADVDAGPRTRGSYHMDDMVGSFAGVVCAPLADYEIPVKVRVAYVYDNDGDGGITNGYFGIALINYPMYWGNMKIPDGLYVTLTNARFFRGLQPYEDGGEPTNDFERYDVLSSYRRDHNSDTANDYKILLSAGPFGYLPPDSSIVVDFAFVCGEGLEGMLQSAANATIYFDGCWVDHDKNPETGILGRETPVMGPLEMWEPDPCNFPGWRVDIPAKTVFWSNIDCHREHWPLNYIGCYRRTDVDAWTYATGVDGKETQVHWIAGSAPSPPNLRAIPGDHMVTLIWDNLSETVPDQLSQKIDFEGYQIWRADDWHRPIGTSIHTGPRIDSWRLLATKDIENGLPPDDGFEKPYDEGGWIYEPIPNIEERDKLVTMFEESILYAPMDTVPCPPGLENEVCDTLEAIARDRLGFEGGRRYYKYVDTKPKNGLPYFYAVTAFDHAFENGQPSTINRRGTPASNFVYVEPQSSPQPAEMFEENEIYVVPNPVTARNMEPWAMGPTNSDPSGLKLEFRNMPQCLSTVRIFTVSGDLVSLLHHDGRDRDGTLAWNLITRNGQDVTSGVYLYSVEPDDGRFPRAVGKFVVIR